MELLNYEISRRMFSLSRQWFCIKHYIKLARMKLIHDKIFVLPQLYKYKNIEYEI